MAEDHPHNRRIDRIRDTAFVADLGGASLEDLRARRDDCAVERDHLSMLRRMIQGRAEILQAEVVARGLGEESSLVGRLAKILAPEDHPVTSRGEVVRVAVPEEELLLARRSAERLVNDVAISDPTTLDDEGLAQAIERLAAEEHRVSEARSDVIRVMDVVLDELKRRYRDDPSLALR